jgi:hypothetical protein
MKEKVLEMTNDAGKKFFRGCIEKYDILGIETTPSNISRKEFTIVYRDSDGCIRTAILPDSSTNNDGTCFFGDLKHFSMCYAEEKANVHLRLTNSGHLYWPAWYLNEEDFLRWKKFYNEMMQKYS